MDDGRRTWTRVLAAGGGVWGLALLTGPRRVVAALCPELPESRIWVVRVLGARLVAQHAVVLAAPRPTAVRAAAAVDALHAASMVPLLAAPRYRRAALLSGVVATAWAVLATRASG
jgi:hypothetical protein